VKFEDWPDEWQEWAMLTPLERFRESEEIFAQYLAMGGSLDPEPDPTSPFTIQATGTRTLLMGGQACVFYGAAQVSKDVGFLILADDANFTKLHEALTILAAKRIAVPRVPRWKSTAADLRDRRARLPKLLVRYSQAPRPCLLLPIASMH
jgi:hypothetical protein